MNNLNVLYISNSKIYLNQNVITLDTSFQHKVIDCAIFCGVFGSLMSYGDRLKVIPLNANRELNLSSSHLNFENIKSTLNKNLSKRYRRLNEFSYYNKRFIFTIITDNNNNNNNNTCFVIISNRTNF